MKIAVMSRYDVAVWLWFFLPGSSHWIYWSNFILWIRGTCGLVVASLPSNWKVVGSNLTGWNFSKIGSQPSMWLKNGKGPFWIGKNNNNNKNKETKKAYRSPCSCLLCHELYHLVSNTNMQMLFQNDLKNFFLNFQKKKIFFLNFFFKFFQLFLNFLKNFLKIFFKSFFHF